MKTLDEVIEAIRFCKSGDLSKCKDCPYIGTCELDYAVLSDDALHYLREYRETKKHLACLDDAEIRGDNTQVVNNPPLSWDELKSMEGKPVWVEYGIGFNQKRWVIIHSFHNTGSFCYMNVSGNYPNTFWQKDMGEDEFWKAYRKERE